MEKNIRYRSENKIDRDGIMEDRLMQYCELSCIIFFLLLEFGAQDKGLKKAPL